MQEGETLKRDLTFRYVPDFQWDISEEDSRSMFYNPVTDERMRISMPPRDVMNELWEKLKAEE